MVYTSGVNELCNQSTTRTTKNCLNKIKEEAALLRDQGFAILSWGDYNAHIGDSIKDGIAGNKHLVNNNGEREQKTKTT